MAPFRYLPPLAHLAIIAACAATAWWRIETAPPVPTRAAIKADLSLPAPASAAGQVVSGGDDREDSVQTVAERALFLPGRLVAADLVPIATPIAPESSAPAFVPLLRMVGSLDQGSQQLAILETEDGQSHIVHEGDEIAGARVRLIGVDAVVIGSGDQEVTLRLYPD